MLRVSKFKTWYRQGKSSPCYSNDFGMVFLQEKIGFLGGDKFRPVSVPSQALRVHCSEQNVDCLFHSTPFNSYFLNYVLTF